MSVKVIEGNVLKASEKIIGHQTNIYGVMGAGVAAQIQNMYPHVYAVYNKHCNETPSTALLGTVQLVPTGVDDKIIANIFSQEEMSFTKDVTNYEAMYKAFMFLKTTGESIALPYNIGCGIAGGDWNIVSKLIHDIFDDYEPGVTLYKYVKPQNTMTRF